MNIKKSVKKPTLVAASSSTEPQGQAGNSYREHTNGTRAPPWQNSGGQYGKMFVVPTQLKEYDEITIKGTMVDGMVNIGLGPDNTGQQFNVVCQLNVVYPENGQPNNQIEIRSIQNGDIQDFGQERQATDYFDGENFHVSFKLRPQAIILMVGESHLESIPLRHNHDDVKFILVKGQVQELNFTFAKSY